MTGSTTPRVAVVGAGAAGCGAAYALGDADVTVLEARGRAGGRMATARRGGCVYDYGANYVKADDAGVTALLTGPLSAGLVETAGDVRTFDADGRVSPGRDDDGHKWTYREGLAVLADRLLAAADVDLRTGAAVASLERVDGGARDDPAASLSGEGGWRVRGSVGDLPAFDAVVVTPPAPATADVLADTDWDDPLRAELLAAAREVPYRSVVTAALHYPFELDRPWYALLNTDREHEVGWVAREECKPGHVPDDESLLVVQMAPDWSAERLAHPDGAVARAAADLVADLLGDSRLAAPDWTDCRRFRHALPDAGVDPGPFRRAEASGLAFAGDWLVGEGRVHAALRAGLDAGDRLAAD